MPPKRIKSQKIMIVVKNHVGSSKSMEPDIAVDLFQRATMSKIKCYVTLVMMTPQLMHTYTKKFLMILNSSLMSFIQNSS